MNDRRIQQSNKNHIIYFPLFEINDVVKLVVEKGKARMESGILPPISAVLPSPRAFVTCLISYKGTSH